MKYTDFIIRARDWQEGQFKVEVTASPMDRMRHPENAVYSSSMARPLRNLEKKNIPHNQLTELGETLAEMLLPATVRQMLLSSLEAVPSGQGLRLRLVLDDVRVANLPWEYMYMPRPGAEKGHYGFLGLDPRVSIVRHEAIPVAPGSVAARLPLKLVVGFSSPAGTPKLDLETERSFIEEALSGVPEIEVEFVENLTIQKLEAACQGAHMFHYAGHGGFFWEATKGVAGRGAIFLEDEQGGKSPFSVDNLALTLRAAGVQVVVLGSCETGRRDGVNVWSGIAPALMSAGVPATVAMQYAIRDDAAIAFSRRFYQALATGLSLDEAVMLGRLAILNQCGEDGIDWGVPVLYMRSTQGVIFPEVSADPALEKQREEQRVTVVQRAQALYDQLMGIEISEAYYRQLEVSQDIQTIAEGGKAMGASFDQVNGGVIRTEQRVGVVSKGGKVMGIHVRKLR